MEPTFTEVPSESEADVSDSDSDSPQDAAGL